MSKIPNSPISRRRFLATSAAYAAASSRITSHAASRPPNVVFIMSDDMGYGDLGCHGNPHLKTPHLDRLYAESTRLTQYYHSPVCTPTRASLMTGRYNYRTCAIDTFRGRAMMHPDETTVAEMLSNAGYATGIFGKWHLGDCFPMRACDQGFRESLVHRGGGLMQPSDVPGGGGYFDPILVKDGALEPRKGYCTDIFASEAVAFMERRRDTPFFLYLPTNAPHSPLEVDDRYVTPYREAGLPDPVAKVYGMIANLDENVGRVLDAIDRLNLRENTIVIFTTDNGAQMPNEAQRFNAGMRGQKGTVYEGGIRVPFFVRWPGLFEPGRAIGERAAHIDLAPTLLDICGVARPEGARFDGQSLLPLLRGDETALPDRTLFFQWHRGDTPEHYNNCCALTRRYKLVNGVELYDLIADHGEENDIAARNPELVSRLRHEYEAWFDDVSATRGFEPPKIVVGDKRANPVYLTLQDMRGGDGPGYGMGGHWKLNVIEPGRYDVVLRFAPEVKGGTATLLIGGVKIEAPIADGASEVIIKGIQLPRGPASLRGWANKQEWQNGARYADLQLA